MDIEIYLDKKMFKISPDNSFILDKLNIHIFYGLKEV
jgi:hypothetical protein